VAFTFVTPEEGGELTRIEQRINRQLKRDEIHGLELVQRARGPLGPAGEGAAEGEPAEPATPPPPPFAPRRPRHRRAL
jgi:superfamily II DNA/RNA helicase